MPSIQSLTMTFDALNDYGTFSEGDPLTGTVTLVLVKEITVEGFFVKSKGDANVHWSTKRGDRTYSYTAHERLFKLKQFLLPVNSKDIVVPAGTHVYKFSFKIPAGSMPSSFRGNHGKIVYMLEVKLSRSWRIDRTLKKEINFASKSVQNLQSLMTPQIGSTDKDMFFFSKGNVHMDVSVDRTAYAPGETVAIVAKINNSSSSDMTPKFSLIRDVVFHAQGNTKHEEHVVQKLSDSCIKSRTQKTVNCALKVPWDVCLSIQNCDIISVKYHLKIYLDISLASDPKVVFPVVIVPPDLAPGHQPSVAAGPYPGGAFGGESNSVFPPPAAHPAMPMVHYPVSPIRGTRNSNFPLPAGAMGPYPAGALGPYQAGALGPYQAGALGPCQAGALGPYQAGALGPYQAGAIRGPSSNSIPPPEGAFGPYPYGHPGAQSNAFSTSQYPPQPARGSGGYNNPAPRLTSPYGSSSSPVLHPPPTAPTFIPSSSAPAINPPPFSALSNMSLDPPAYNTLPSAPVMNTDFLAQSDEPPPAYSVLFQSSATEQSNANQ